MVGVKSLLSQTVTEKVKRKPEEGIGFFTKVNVYATYTIYTYVCYGLIVCAACIYCYRYSESLQKQKWHTN